MGLKSRDGGALGETVLMDDLGNAMAVGDRVSRQFMQQAELVGLAMQQVGMGFDLVLSTEGVGQLLLVLAEEVAHFIIQIVIAA